jgi:hypothetical protein
MYFRTSDESLNMAGVLRCERGGGSELLPISKLEIHRVGGVSLMFPPCYREAEWAKQQT